MNYSPTIIFGEALVDIFKMGLVVGGAPFNVARHFAGFGLNTHFISAIGQDNAGVLVKQEISKFNMYDKGLQLLSDKPTGSVQVHEDANGHTFEIKKNAAYDYIQSEAASQSVAQYFEDAQLPINRGAIFYHGTLALRGEESYQAFCQVAQKAKAYNSVSYIDINWREGFVSSDLVLSVVQNSNVVKASIEELQMLLDWQSLPAVAHKSLPKVGFVAQQVAQALDNSSVRLLFVTYGELGSAVFDKNGKCLAVSESKQAVSMVDTVGAGDAFSSVILLALINDWPLDLSLRRANAFAGAVCGIRGAIPNDLNFYQRFVNEWGLAA